jgi:hypothetical protein
MEEKEALRVQLEDTMSFQHKIRLFAMSNLSQDNPFRQLIEEQTCRSVSELKGALEKIDGQKVAVGSSKR